MKGLHFDDVQYSGESTSAYVNWVYSTNEAGFVSAKGHRDVLWINWILTFRPFTGFCYIHLKYNVSILHPSIVDSALAPTVYA